ncbi:branched-chain amino acid ABC transporter permease [Coprothermobacteraceae bacterium]|nr:branched-chain amino acid ABC transporter permease [Coprothermobacteraceae bacterium]
MLGSVYALIALGYTIVYGIIRFINFAHGDIFMVSAYIVFAAVSYWKLGFFGALVAAVVGAVILGVTIEKVAYRPLRKAPKISLLITAIGVSLFLENFVALPLVMGSMPKVVPSFIPIISYTVGGVRFTSAQVIIFGLAVVLMALLGWFIRNTKLGRAMRAVSTDYMAVPLMGLSVDSIISSAFAIGSGLAAVGGLLYVIVYPMVDPFMGIMIGTKAFISAVVGGIGNIYGAVAGAYLIALLEVLVVAAGYSTWRDAVAFGLLIVVLLLKPSGLFGKFQKEKV